MSLLLPPLHDWVPRELQRVQEQGWVMPRLFLVPGKLCCAGTVVTQGAGLGQGHAWSQQPRSNPCSAPDPARRWCPPRSRKLRLQGKEKRWHWETPTPSALMVVSGILATMGRGDGRCCPLRPVGIVPGPCTFPKASGEGSEPSPRLR